MSSSIPQGASDIITYTHISMGVVYGLLIIFTYVLVKDKKKHREAIGNNEYLKYTQLFGIPVFNVVNNSTLGQ